MPAVSLLSEVICKSGLYHYTLIALWFPADIRGFTSKLILKYEVLDIACNDFWHQIMILAKALHPCLAHTFRAEGEKNSFVYGPLHTN